MTKDIPVTAKEGEKCTFCNAGILGTTETWGYEYLQCGGCDSTYHIKETDEQRHKPN
jgi:hypothetical protein